MWQRTHSGLVPIAPNRSSFAPAEPCGLWQLAQRSVRVGSAGSRRPSTGWPIVGCPARSDVSSAT
ncbi:MAG: hypothetical protein DMF93_03465 [Acidobacteria bacterium]|nr:MAG: hypothetical protein DMF93_03465 [Acidobacteriota bacterium]